MKKMLLFVLPLLFAATACTHSVPPQAGTIVRDTLSGVPCCIYLPQAYAERAQKQEIFPVLYLQHGMFGSEDDWTKQGRLVAIMDSLLRRGEVKEMVVVMPDNFLGSLPPTERQALMAAADVTPDGEPFDTSNGAAHWRKLTYEQEKNCETSGYWETHFAAFMAEAEQRYRVSREPSQRAVAGLSMGGYHTMMVAHELDGQFAYVGMFSPATFVHYAPSEPALLWVGIGNEDFLYDMLQDYRHWLETNHREYTYYESAGGHDWPNWQDYIGRFLKLLF